MQTPHALISRDGLKDEPVGDDIARATSIACATAGFMVSDIDRWREVGFVFSTRANNRAFEIYYAAYAGAILLAVAPLEGVVTRLFRRAPAAAKADQMYLCRTIHLVLEQMPNVSRIRWMMGGPPERVRQVNRPDELLFGHHD